MTETKFSGKTKKRLAVGLTGGLLALIIGGIIIARVYHNIQETAYGKLNQAQQFYSDWQAAKTEQSEYIDKSQTDETAGAEEARSFLALLPELEKSRIKHVRLQAAFLAANYAYEQKEYAKAAGLFAKAAQNKNFYLSESAGMNYAAALEADGKPEEALNAYRLLSLNRKNTVWQEALFQTARLSESSDQETAIALYEELASGLEGGNIWRIVSENRLIALKAGL